MHIKFCLHNVPDQQFLYVTRFCLSTTEQQGSFEDLFTHVKTKAILF
jgi:hypothetical protein